MVVMLVLFMIIGFLTVDYIIQRAAQRREIISTPRRLQGAESDSRSRLKHPRYISNIDELPGGLFISPWHVWVNVTSSGTLRLGVDRVLLAFLGGLDCVYALPEGSEVTEGGPLLMLRHGQRALKIRSPVDGIVTGVNDRTRRIPSRISGDPFDAGWLYSISPTRLSANLKKLLVAEDASLWMRREIGRLRDLLQSASAGEQGMVTLADGGLPLVQQLAELEGTAWEGLVEKFFSGKQFEVS